jgi:hypothetical protein
MSADAVSFSAAIEQRNRYRAKCKRLEAENETLRAALEPLAAQAQDILDVLASGSEPWAATGYGYEHMGDYTRDVKPLCEALVALASGDTDTQESK